MTYFKEYRNNNPAVLDDQEVPSGHEFRFEAKLDAMLESAQKKRTDKASRRKRIFTGIFSGAAVVAAAAVAAVMFINRPVGKVDWFAGVANDPRAVSLAYSEKFTRDLENHWETTVSSIAEETVPMIDQLPEELDDAAKAVILKEYYGELLDGLDKINKIKEL